MAVLKLVEGQIAKAADEVKIAGREELGDDIGGQVAVN
jgi:hypothetical protein